jgi:rhodanese-related sulfurtransferase
MDINAPSNQDYIYEELTRIGKIMANAKRVQLLDLLCQSEYNVETLAKLTDLKFTTASAHLQILRQSRLVITRNEGTHIYYRIAGPEVYGLLVAFNKLAMSHLAEVKQVLQNISCDTERVSRKELLKRVKAGDVIVLDVRPIQEFNTGHIPNAISIPLEHLEARLNELDPNIEIVAYCRGALCLLAPQATIILSKHQRNSRCLEGGFVEWAEDKLPVEVGVKT